MENDAEVAPRVKKRKCAIFVVYLGHKYQGMQRNPGVKTIEDELFQAMCKAGAISEKLLQRRKHSRRSTGRGQPGRTRACRPSARSSRQTSYLWRASWRR
jgi:hypothetical protein